MRKPTVTELLDLLNKPALINWANKIGLQGIKLEEYRTSKKEGGISLHKQIENKLINNTPIQDEQLRLKFDLWIETVEILAVEKTIETQYFVGRLDRIEGYNVILEKRLDGVKFMTDGSGLDAGEGFGESASQFMLFGDEGPWKMRGE